MAKPLPDDLEAWERQLGESPQAFQAFAVYRDQLARRSTHKVAQELSKSDGLIHRWCGRWRWVVRARAYDRYLDGQARQNREAEILDFRKRAVEHARGKANSLMLPDRAITAKLQEPDAFDELRAMSISDLLALSSRCAAALPQLLKTEAWALGDETGRFEALEVKELEDDLVVRAIQEDAEALGLAQALLDRASALYPKED